MERLKSIIRSIVFKYIKPPIIRNSNAQAGEDVIVEFLFNSMGIANITYIDIGANDPVSDNNTYLFYLNHNCGVLIEPNEDFNGRIKKMRPKDIIINAAISDKENSEGDFFVFDSTSLNTLSKEQADLRCRSGIFQLTAVRKIKLLSIEYVISHYLNDQVPELISLDIEGMDCQILSSFNFNKYPVPVWIVETCQYSEDHIKPKVNSVIDLMLSKGYFVYADTYINTIFVNTRWFNNYNAS
jgi:FkbM family methyltransferase